MCYQFSKASIDRMDGVHQDLVKLFLYSIKNSPIDFGIPKFGGLRTALEQNKLYRNGVSNADGVLNLSKHQEGLALDVFAYVDGKASWNKAHLSMIAGVILSNAVILRKKGFITSKIKWGGTFASQKLDGWDMPHFEIC